MKLNYYVFLPFVILAAIASLWICYARINIERDLNTVNLAMDYDEWESFCLQNGYKFEETLPLLKGKGISSFGVYEDTCKRLSLRGEIAIFNGSDILNSARVTELSNSLLEELVKENKITPRNVYIIFPPSSSHLKNIQDYFIRFFGKERVALFENSSSSVVEVSGDYSDVVNMGLGMPANITGVLEKNGFSVIARIENRIVDPEKLNFIFEDLKHNPNCSTLIFSGMFNEALGYPDYLKETAENIKNNNLYFGFIEVADLENLQKGAMTIANNDITRVVRVISITQAYQQKLNLDQMIDIWSLAVRERNIRLLYMRPLLELQEKMNPLESNLYYFQLCKDEIEGYGFKLGSVKGMRNFSPPVGVKALLAMGIISAIVLLLSKMFELSFKRAILLGVLAFMAFIPGLIVIESFFSKLIALAGGIIFPVFAIVFGAPFLFDKTSENLCNKNKLCNFIFPIKILWKVSLMTILGGLISVGIVSSTPFFLTVDRFRGVKFIMILPIFLIFTLYFYLEADKDRLLSFLKKVKSMFNYPLYMWHFFLILIICAAGAFYVMRTGNTTAVPVSDLERTIRSTLDHILLVRPRFKDFLLGCPAFILAVFFYRKGIKGYLWVFMTLSAIGQADFVDTFAHLHTPLEVSLIRIFHGIWIGSIVGIIFIMAYNILSSLKDRFEKLYKSI